MLRKGAHVPHAPARRRTVRSALLVAALVAGAVVPLTAAGAGAATTAPGTDSDEARATARAKAMGTPVEVESHRGEATTVFANPDGTLRMDVSNVPVRTRRGGSWLPIDTTLVVRGDGRVAPRAAALDMELSGGGTAPLVRLSRGGGVIELTAPFALPAPTLTGDTATYAEVLPGVDLVVQAGADTFAERLVVKSATAAANPALASLTFPTRTTNLRLRPDAGGGLEAVDATGSRVLAASAPLMWDSSGTPGTQGPATAARSAAPEGPRQAASAEGGHPDEADRIAPVGVTLTSGALTLRPDLDLLRGRDTTYPVYVDPTLAPTRSGWAMVNKTYPSQEYWKWTGDSDKAEGMGYIDDPLSGRHTKRLYYQFTTSGLNGKTIYGATFTAFETHAFSCTATKVEAWHTGTVSSSTNWDRQPGNIASNGSSALQDSATVAVGRSGCTPGGKNIPFTVTPAVKYQAGKGATYTTIKLKAASESHESGWKRFKYTATLSVVYNTTPPAPSGRSTIEPRTACTTGSGRPVIPNDPPKLVAKISDADSGENVRGSFELATLSGTILKTYLAPASAPNNNQIYDLQAPYPLPAGLPEGSYKWRVRTKDPKVYGPYSGWCEFTVDKTAPAPPTVGPTSATAALISPGPFPYGETAAFTVSSTDPGVKTYRWSVNSGVPTSSAVTYATSPTFSVPLAVYGPVVVRVWTYDQAGNRSTLAAENNAFTVGGIDLARDLRARWRMDATAGTVAPDAVGVTASAANGASPMTLAGGASFVAGGQQVDAFPSDGALQLNAGTATAATAATTSTTVLDLARNATVTAWVKLSPTTARTVAVSHDAAGGANLTLEQRTVPTVREDPITGDVTTVDEQHFVATVRIAGRSAPLVADVPVPVAFDEWYHLGATWSPGERQLTLEVADAEGVALDAVAADTDADGDTQAGAVRVGGAGTSTGGREAYWPGLVDEVAVYGNVVPPEQLNQLRTAPHG